MAARFAGKSRGASRRPAQQTGLDKARWRFPVLKRVLLSCLAMAVLTLIGVNAKRLYEHINQHEVAYVVIDGELNYVSEREVQTAVGGFAGQSLLAVRLERLQQTLEANPWIRSAAIKRQWPDTLVITVMEEVPIARWGSDQLLNQQGDIFSPSSVNRQLHLAELSGPTGSEQMVMEQYQEFNRILYPQGLRITSLSLNDREAWSMVLGNGIQVNIGRDRALEKVRSFAQAFNRVLQDQTVFIESVDLRYKNGMAVKSRQNASEELLSLNP